MSRTYVETVTNAWREGNLDTKRMDLLAILAFRFGLVSDGVQRKITEITDDEALIDLISVAINSHAWKNFIDELNQRQIH